MANDKSKLTVLNRVIFYALFVVASFFVYWGMYIFYPVITHNGRLLFQSLPVWLMCGVPLFLLIMFRRFSNAVGHKMKWKIALGADVAVLAVSLYSFISCLAKYIKVKKVLGTTTPFYPLDMVIIDAVFLIAAAVGLFFILRKKEYLKEHQPEQPIKEYRNVLAGVYLAFASYWFGEILFSINLAVGADFDPNLPWVMANYFAMALPTIGLVLFEIYHHLKPAKQRVGWIILLSIYSFLVVAFFTWVFTGIAVNPSCYPESMQPMFIMGYCISMPIGIFILLADCAITIVVSTIFFIKSSNK